MDFQTMQDSQLDQRPKTQRGVVGRRSGVGPAARDVSNVDTTRTPATKRKKPDSVHPEQPPRIQETIVIPAPKPPAPKRNRTERSIVQHRANKIEVPTVPARARRNKVR